MSWISRMGVAGEATSMRHVPTCDRDTPDQRRRARSGAPCQHERTWDRTRMIMPNAASLDSRLRFVIRGCTPKRGAGERESLLELDASKSCANGASTITL